MSVPSSRLPSSAWSGAHRACSGSKRRSHEAGVFPAAPKSGQCDDERTHGVNPAKLAPVLRKVAVHHASLVAPVVLEDGGPAGALFGCRTEQRRAGDAPSTSRG